MDALKKAAWDVVEAWEWDPSEPRNKQLRQRVMTLRQLLSQPEQEPVAWLSKSGKGIWFHEPDSNLNATPLYTAPPKREWVGLTDEDYEELLKDDWGGSLIQAVEAKLKEKNT